MTTENKKMAEKKVVECEGVYCKHAERNCTWWVAHVKRMKDEKGFALSKVKPSYHYY